MLLITKQQSNRATKVRNNKTPNQRSKETTKEQNNKTR
jgi:hypothetical protein